MKLEHYYHADLKVNSIELNGYVIGFKKDNLTIMYN